jgi:hypothetical protein
MTFMTSPPLGPSGHSAERLRHRYVECANATFDIGPENFMVMMLER